KIEVPAVVHRASLEDGDIYGVEKPPIIIRHLSQIERHVVATADVMLPAVVGRKMPAEHVEMLAFRIIFDHSEVCQLTRHRIKKLTGIRRVIASRRTMKAKVNHLSMPGGFASKGTHAGVCCDARNTELL